MSTENNFILQIQYNFSDIINADRLYRISLSSLYQIDKIVGVVCFALGILNLFLLAFLALNDLSLGEKLSKEHFNFGPIIYLAIGILLYFDIIPATTLWLRFQKNKEENIQPFKVLFTNSLIVFSGQNHEAQYKWEYFKSSSENEHLFILVYGKNLYFSIPKRSFQNDNDVDAFRKFISSKLSSNKRAG